MNDPFMALMFAEAAHAAVNQRRKFTNEPYIVHPVAVAQLLKKYGHGHDSDMLCAAYLHDVVEDTSVGMMTIGNYFDRRVVELVRDLTNTVPKSAGNRAKRFELELQRISKISQNAQTIKLCDVMDNMRTIVEHDPAFAKVWMNEKRQLLPYLSGGDYLLWRDVNAKVEEYYACSI